MPRSATTLIKRHGKESKWEILHGPDVPFPQQQADFRKIRGTQSHPKLAEYRFQESDGTLYHFKFRTTAQQKEHDNRREQELEESKKVGELEEERRKALEESRKAAKKAHDAYIAAHNKQVMSDPNRTGSGSSGNVETFSLPTEKAETETAETGTE